MRSALMKSSLFIRIIMSWVHPDQGHPFVRLIYSVTEPVLDPIRRVLPTGGFGIDFSPIIVFLILEFLQRLTAPYVYYGL
jgi:YggT family protein